MKHVNSASQLPWKTETKKRNKSASTWKSMNTKNAKDNLMAMDP